MVVFPCFLKIIGVEIVNYRLIRIFVRLIIYIKTLLNTNEKMAY